MVIIDPISAYLDGVDSHKTTDVRGALVPLQVTADQLGAAVLMVSHFNKGTPDSTAMSRVAGSGAFVAVCRSAWLVERNPQDATGNRHVHQRRMKNNIGDDKTSIHLRDKPSGDRIGNHVKLPPLPPRHNLIISR